MKVAAAIASTPMGGAARASIAVAMHFVVASAGVVHAAGADRLASEADTGVDPRTAATKAVTMALAGDMAAAVETVSAALRAVPVAVLRGLLAAAVVAADLVALRVAVVGVAAPAVLRAADPEAGWTDLQALDPAAVWALHPAAVRVAVLAVLLAEPPAVVPVVKARLRVVAAAGRRVAPQASVLAADREDLPLAQVHLRAAQGPAGLLPAAVQALERPAAWDHRARSDRAKREASVRRFPSSGDAPHKPQSNRLETLSSFAVRAMASPISEATDSTRMFFASFTASVGRIVSVMTSSLSFEADMRAAAPFERTPWVI